MRAARLFILLTRVVSFFAAVHTLLSATRETCNTHLTRTLFALLPNVVSFCRIVTAALLVFVASLPRAVTSLLVLLPRAVTNYDHAHRTAYSSDCEAQHRILVVKRTEILLKEKESS